MNKEKVDFIAGLLNNQKIKLADKERLFNLSLSELSKITTTDDELRKEIDEIKNIVGSNALTLYEKETPATPRYFKGKFADGEKTVIADGVTENKFCLKSIENGQLIDLPPMIVFYKDLKINAKFKNDGTLSELDPDLIYKIEGIMCKKIQEELSEYLKSKESKIREQNLQNITKSVSLLQQTDLPIYKSPSELTFFLKAYNQDPILKYTCHEFDEDGLIAVNKICKIEEFSLQKFQQCLVKSFKKLMTQYKIPTNTRALINVYLNGGTEWATDKVRINWKSIELFEWSIRNPGIAPNPGNDLIAKSENYGFEFNNVAFRSKLLDRRISSFSQLVIYFKSLFHIRRDNSLKNLIENTNTRKGWNDKISFDISDITENIEFFTDVDKLIQAYVKIINIILDISEKQNLGEPIVRISLREINNNIVFSIQHENSTYSKTIRNTLERIGQLHTELIKNQINGLCDLYIQADFGNNEFAKINLWNGEERNAEKLSEFKGVEYQLIFI